MNGIFHEEVLEILLKYREKSPKFNFIARQRNTKNRFETGKYFQGNEKYAFVGLINKSGGANRTRSVGLVFRPSGNEIQCEFEIVYKGETNQDLLSFYQNLKELFPDGKQVQDQKFSFIIGNITTNNYDLLFEFLDKYYPQITSIAKESNLKDLIISDEKFERILSKIQKFRSSTNYWIFQSNPEIYNIEEALRAGQIKSWKVAAHKNKIKPGDKVILWKTGKSAGCYALAEVNSEVGDFEEDDSEKGYYTVPDSTESTSRVKLNIDKNLAENPVLWDKIKDLPGFEKFKGGYQGSTFSATKEQYETVLDLADEPKKGEYWEVKKLFPNEEVEKFLSVIRKFILNNKLDPYDERLTFQARSGLKRLVLIIGNRPSLAIDFRNGKSIYSFIHPEILSEKYSEYLNQKGRIEAYWNEVKTLEGIEDKIAEGLQIELENGNKSPTRRSTNPEFIADVMQKETMEETAEKRVNIPSLNTIFYGPPGTGKTYTLQKNYFEKFTVRETALSKERYLQNIVQDLTWWQIFAVALKDLGRVSTSTLLEHPVVKAKERLSSAKDIKPIAWSRLQAHTVDNCPNVKVQVRSEPQIFYKEENSDWRVDPEAIDALYPESDDLIAQVKNYQPSGRNKIKNYEFVTFHQSFTYEDFVEGIKPKLGTESAEISYEITPGIFKKMVDKAKANLDQEFALFIDEINRGNVAAIFGELITLIEDDKRMGRENELSVKLPYSKEDFVVPPNLYILGTMNTADRSVEALDAALRRRFSFEEVMPKPHLLEEISFQGFNLKEVLKTINSRIEALLDRDHMIGHSYFIKIRSGDKPALREAFKNKIIPLLQEYFYHDYQKIALILGEGFVEKKEGRVQFANFQQLQEPEILPSFELKKEIEDIETAILKLLNRSDE